MSLIYYYVVSPGEPLHHFSPHHRQRPDNSQTRSLGVRVSFPSHSNNSFPLYNNNILERALQNFGDPFLPLQNETALQNWAGGLQNWAG